MIFSGNRVGEINDNGTGTIYGTGDTEAPTAPSGLTATSVTATQVDLTWNPSTDNVSVTGYDILRDGTQISTVGSATTTYQDSTVNAATAYQYAVHARDAAGNLSPLSNLLNVTTPAPSPTLSFTPTDDATIRETSPTQNFGSADALEVDASSRKDSLLRFDIIGVDTTPVAKVTLRLFNIDRSPAGGEFLAYDPNWNESTVTWNNAPAGNGSSFGTLDSVSVNTWYEVDVTPLVTGDGPVSLRIISSHRNGADYSSKEHANGNAPELLVELGASAASVQASQLPTESTASTDSDSSGVPMVDQTHAIYLPLVAHE